MARRKQPRPTRPKRSSEEVAGSTLLAPGDDNQKTQRAAKRRREDPPPETNDLAWRNFLLPEIADEDGKTVAEVNLVVAASSNGATRPAQNDNEHDGKSYTLRVRMQLPPEVANKSLGLSEMSRQDLRVQFLAYSKRTSGGDVDDVSTEPKDNSGAPKMEENIEGSEVLLSGEVDYPNAVVSALTYLLRQGFTTLRPAPCPSCGSPSCRDHELTDRVSVVITRKAFLRSGGHKQIWMTAMRTLICLLRPELMSETRARWLNVSLKDDEEIARNFEQGADSTVSGKQRVFDPSALYDAIKPSGNEPGLDKSFPELLPDLRPYQRRAANWMIQREKGFGARLDDDQSARFTSILSQTDYQRSSSATTENSISDRHPLWLPVLPVDSAPGFFFNPFSGAVSLEPRDLLSYVQGGILADEMGLGKTVELLACILANPYEDASVPSAADTARKLLNDKIEARKGERVDCACGATEDDEEYAEPWVQCDVCDAWQHSTCVGFVTPPHLKEQIDEPYKSRRAISDPVRKSREGLNGVKTKGPRSGSKRPQRSAGEGDDSTDRSTAQTFVCGTCAALIGSAEVKGVCKATLVVCPAPILQQWQDEILRHTKEGFLRVIVYEGVRKGGVTIMNGREIRTTHQKRLNIVSAHDLAAADVVLTTYDTLKADLYHESDKTKSNQRSLRYIKRYPVIPTPLTRLCWWRVCLDEAQMVESSTTKTTEMAQLLEARNRWCVSGTPIQRGLDDLFGLLRFIQAEPFNDYQNWNQALRLPYEAGDPHVMSYLHKFLRLVMWRSSKFDVKNELNLPPMEESVSWLRFSPVEAHFYRQQHEKCALKARAVIARFGRQQVQSSEQSRIRTANPAASREIIPDGQAVSVPDDGQGNTSNRTIGPDSSVERRIGDQGDVAATPSGSCHTNGTNSNDSTNMARVSTQDISNATEDRPLSHSEASYLSSSLLRLRQACCHPQVGSAGIRSLQQRTPMTMDEILQLLVNKAKIEAEEALRALIGALNGLAALATIEKDIPLAVSIYREALALTEENAGDVDVDPLQKLHTLHNLGDILGISSSVWDGEADFQSDRLAPTSMNPNSAYEEKKAETIVERPSIPGYGTNGQDATVVSAAHNVVDIIKRSNFDTQSDCGPGMDKGFVVADGAPKPKPFAGDMRGAKIGRTLRDDSLLNQCQEIRLKYMVFFNAKLARGLADFEVSNRQVSEAKQNCEASGGFSWWLEVLKVEGKRKGKRDVETETHAVGGGRDLLYKIRAHLLESDNYGKKGQHRNASSLALRFGDMSGLKYVLQKELDGLESARNQVLELVKTLNRVMVNPTVRDAEQIANCPRDNENVNGSVCAHCQLDDLFQIYGNRLFLLRTYGDGVLSADDAVTLQRRVLARRRVSGSKDPDSYASRKQTLAEETLGIRNTRGTAVAGATEAEVLSMPSETEQVLSILRAQARTLGGLHDAAAKHLQLFEVMKKEFTQMRALAKVQRDALFALDELNMATTRLSLQLPGEVVENEVEKLIKLPMEEVPQRNVQLTTDKFDAESDLSRTKGQLRYLKGLSLARQQAQTRDPGSFSTLQLAGRHQQEGATPMHSDEELCPVCQDKLGLQLMVLPCGHLLCCKCCMALIERTPIIFGHLSQKRINCPTCRQRANVGDIALVDNGSDRNAIAAQMGQFSGDQADEEASMHVEGSYGTKIEAVVKKLLWVKSKDPSAKVLLFSSWHDVLNVIEHALSANKITFAKVKTTLGAAIQKFRGNSLHTSASSSQAAASSSNEHVQVLLLMIERGGNGLNLVEAQHVIIVEPSPNPAIEAQAINRIHRIGQTRATFVYRFIITETVEESIYWLGRKKAELSEKFPGSGINSRRRNQYTFTLNDVSALFASKAPVDANAAAEVTFPVPLQTTPRLPPNEAAAAAAEARLRRTTASPQVVS